MTTLHGQCLCGTVHYTITDGPGRVSHCHCAMCRKAHGAAFASYGVVPTAQHRFTAGQEAVRAFQSSGSTVRSFCSHCGSPLTWVDEVRYPGIVGYPLGGIDTPFTFEVAAAQHIYTAHKAPWHEILDASPQIPC